MIGASAALALSGVPFNGPIGACRIGYADGQYLLNPTATQLKDSELNLVVAGTEIGVMMVESEANVLSEEVMLGAVVYGHQQMQTAIQAINELADEAGKPEWDWKAPEPNEALIAKVKEKSRVPRSRKPSRSPRSCNATTVCPRSAKKLFAALVTGEQGAPTETEIKDIFFGLESAVVRNRILGGQPRIDGRDTRTVRPISIRTGVLPRTHGSALFTRGETQALVIATLGTGRDEQVIDAIAGEYKERFMLHYNMPPYATGETGRMGAPKRREVGHGPSRQARAARRAAGLQRFRLHGPPRLRNHRIERFELDGVGLRRLAGTDGCGCSAQGAGRGYRDGADQGRQPLSRC